MRPGFRHLVSHDRTWTVSGRCVSGGKGIAGIGPENRRPGDACTGKKGMNLLGELPLDFAGTEFRKQFRERMQEMGLPVSAALFDQADMEQVSHIEAAKWNNAVTYSGALLGAWLWRTYNMPCITGFPMSSRAAEPGILFVTAHLLTGGDCRMGNTEGNVRT